MKLDLFGVQKGKDFSMWDSAFVSLINGLFFGFEPCGLPAVFA